MSATEQKSLLYGADSTEKIVAVEVDAHRGRATILTRNSNGNLVRQFRPFVPWMLCVDEHSFDGAQTSRLSGDAAFKWRIDFTESLWKGFLAARSQLLSEKNAAIIAYSSPSKQFLMSTGTTLFKGMAFGDLNRLQLDIETRSLDPNAGNAGIFIVSLSDSTGRLECLVDNDEARLLARSFEIIRDWDPDVIEGHNIFGFDIPYILTRCRDLGVECRIGRDGSLMQADERRNCVIGPFSRSFTPYKIFGRHIIDTYFAVQRFDQARGGQLASYALKECAKIFGFASEERVYVDRSRIFEIFAQRPDEVIKYASQDVEETRELSALTTPIEFYSAQIMPETYQTCAVIGSGEKIDSLLIRQYLQAGHSVPSPQPPAEFGGGYTECRRAGLIQPVAKADVESLYPSIMLSQQIAPASDTLGIFLPLLSQLTTLRLDAKSKLKSLPKGSPDHNYWDGLQASFKTLINSFYGYIGAAFHFNDYQAADAVTKYGREIVKKIASEIEASGGSVIEIDTDGVYFQPPSSSDGLEGETEFIAKVGAVLPAGIRLVHDGRYKAMISLKIKNYVLETYDGQRILKGSSLRSRRDEPFGRDFLAKALDLILTDRQAEIEALYKETRKKISSGEIGIEQIAKRERVTAKMLTSSLRRSAASAISGGDFKEGDLVYLYQREGGSLALKEDYHQDEDRARYLEKLKKFALRMEGVLAAKEIERWEAGSKSPQSPAPFQTTLDL
jgi:DNA polymerase elongation subunit (family B)